MEYLKYYFCFVLQKWVISAVAKKELMLLHEAFLRGLCCIVKKNLNFNYIYLHINVLDHQVDHQKPHDVPTPQDVLTPGRPHGDRHHLMIYAVLSLIPYLTVTI